MSNTENHFSWRIPGRRIKVAGQLSYRGCNQRRVTSLQPTHLSTIQRSRPCRRVKINPCQARKNLLERALNS
jgi:hypothetical protein